MKRRFYGPVTSRSNIRPPGLFYVPKTAAREIVERMRLLLAFILLGFWPVSSAQPAISPTPTFKLGAVLPLSGSSAGTGQVVAAALRASAKTLLNRGIDLNITVLDSRSNAVYAAAQAKMLISAGVHALLCCETPQVAAQLAAVATAAGLPVLSLAPVDSADNSTDDSAEWPLISLVAGESQVLTKLALSPPGRPLALLAPADELGNRASLALREASLGVVRYPVGRTPLTPEALQAATLEPGSIVIWDNAGGTVQAAEALSARGYTGVRVVRAEVWGELDALSRAELTGAVSVLSPAVLGYRLPDSHPAKEKVSSFRRALSGTLTDADADQVTTAAAAWDAVQLLGAAAEQVLTYTDAGNDPDNTAAVRGALLGALGGLGPVVGAGGTYDFSDDFSGSGELAGNHVAGLLPDSLVFGAWRGGRFLPYP